MKWFSRPKYTTLQINGEKRELPPGVWTKCESCSEYLTGAELEANLLVCPKCTHHLRMTAPKRIESLLDADSFVEHDVNLDSCDPLGFAGYKKKLEKSKESSGLRDAILSGQGRIDGVDVAVAITDFSFVGGSMGSVVGERVARTMEFALRERMPLISVAAGGGGARMQEGMLSLMQMAKTSAAVGRLHEAGVPFISIFTHPTMGGVAASYASLGDILIAEPGALIGFAGPRVIEQTIGQRLPSGFQRAEFLLDHGMLDLIVPRAEMRSTLSRLLCFMSNKQRAHVPLESTTQSADVMHHSDLERTQGATPFQVVRRAKHA